MALNGLLQDGVMAREGGGQRLCTTRCRTSAFMRACLENDASIKHPPQPRTSAG
jgi:hypothetical protein